MREVVITRRYSPAGARRAPAEAGLGPGGRRPRAIVTPPPQALEDALSIADQPLASIAKREEIIYVRTARKTSPSSWTSISPVRHLIETIRNEAHRFAITFHRTRRNAARLTSELADIPGVGKKTVEKLLRTLGSSEQVRGATLEDLARIVGPAVARRVRLYYDNLSAEPLVQIHTPGEPI